MARFENFLNGEMSDDAVESREMATKVTLGVPEMSTRYFIKIGFAGCNTRANNSNGYATKAKAEATILDYQNRR
ncbi:MAG: hypothetical protein DI537_43710 [Stutzerimonas stutzeri]|nr:MAG: hypothetical protein DI537_43710 [Stutzerimonas stutzeri]